MAWFFGGPLHGEKHVVNQEVVVTVHVRRTPIDGAGQVIVGMEEVHYRRVERGHAYGGTVYDPPGDAEPYVLEDWLP